jgi:hypothetical protein
MNKSKSSSKCGGKRQWLPPSSSNTSESLATTNTGEHGVGAASLGQECLTLLEKLAVAKRPDSAEVKRLAEILVMSPKFWPLLEEGVSARDSLLEKFTNGAARAFVTARVGLARNQLCYDKANPIEQLLMDQILTTWLRLHYVQSLSVEQENGGLTEFWDQRLTNALRQHLAIESLAKVRPLSKAGAFLQVNIAEGGGQRVNTQQTPPDWQERKPQELKAERSVEGGQE